MLNRLNLPSGQLTSAQVNIHTDTLNESGFVESALPSITPKIISHPYSATIAAFGGRTIHTYHSEGAGWSLRPFDFLFYNYLRQAAAMLLILSWSAAFPMFYPLPPTRPDPSQATPWTSILTYFKLHAQSTPTYHSLLDAHGLPPSR